MIDRIHYMAWCLDRAAFIQSMSEILNPLTGNPLVTVDPDTGALVPDFGIAIDEIGPIVKGGAWDEDGNVVEEPTVIPGHHVNMFGYGDLVLALTYGLPDEGDIFQSTRILDLLDASMHFVPIAEPGIPAGWEGTSGMRIFDPAVVKTPARVWA
ncbi:hypothetical protein JYU29_05595 [Tianweitania sp. BSSL-BM11]|uniref:Uncharacterized protein n=1 Tax=Tianweitania aestuarii TaxID=2814886 RepID=A0ABS5RSY2_9HYPH|nr:hypothetical protein [Tianweitania aestuarii]MBS9720159.1 hypothetical protein [Tianweitania aestuarii]